MDMMDKHEKVARNIADSLAGYIGTPKRRDELAEDIVDALRAAALEATDKDEMDQSAHDMNELVVTNMLRIFGWKEGTAHQLIVHVKMLHDFHNAWVEYELAYASRHPGIENAKRKSLVAAHEALRRGKCSRADKRYVVDALPQPPVEGRTVMRNIHAGICYRCGKEVSPGTGLLEKISKQRTRRLLTHEDCAIKYRGTDTHYQFNPAPPADIEQADA